MERFDGLDEFVSAHSAELIRVAYLLTGDRGDAQDLLQSALVKVALRWPRLRDGNPGCTVGTVKSLTHRALIKLRHLVPDPVLPGSAPRSASGSVSGSRENA